MLKTKYITLDDFQNYFGVNLITELGGDETYANAFLKRIEVRLEAFLNARLFQNLDRLYPNFTQYQKEQYKYALLEQANYILRNGDISSDSGYEEERGTIAHQGELIKATISRNTKEHLINCGLWSYKVKSYGWGMDFSAWLW